LKFGREATEVVLRAERYPLYEPRRRIHVLREALAGPLEAEPLPADHRGLHEAVVEGALHTGLNVAVDPVLPGDVERMGDELVEMNPALDAVLLLLGELLVSLEPGAHVRAIIGSGRNFRNNRGAGADRLCDMSFVRNMAGPLIGGALID